MNPYIHKFEKIVYTVMGILLIVILIISGITKNYEKNIYKNDNFSSVSNVSQTKRKDPDAPIGIANEFRFTLDEIKHSDALTFFSNHHNIEVYIDEECVYSLTSSDSSIKTPGGFWVIIPLYEDNIGKEICVVLMPLYSDYQDEIPNFLIGSDLAVYKAELFSAIPGMLLSLSSVLVGVFLICLSVYSTLKRHNIFRIYTIGLMALSAGLWRFTYGRFAYLLFENNTVLIYNISLVSLMIVALSMLNLIDLAESKKLSKLRTYLSLAYCVIYATQFILQLTGVLDLREMLKITHITIIISAVGLCINNVWAWIKYPPRSEVSSRRNYSWMLALGVLIDLLLYYFNISSEGLLFVLAAVICYSLLESTRLIGIYSNQKTILEEKEIQLSLSRTATMMSQIRSHFVFNVLNAISGMCKYDPEKADETIVRFSRYLRNNIDIMENDKPIPFTTEIRQLEDYVILEQVRFGDKLEFLTDIEYDNFMIPPLILQPIVENAIKHGITKKEGNGIIVLRTRKTGDNIVITVEDDGVGFNPEELTKENSVGIKNIRFRLLHLLNATLDIETKINLGTKVIITIPSKEEKNAHNLRRR